jgi:uncharacterized membrane protein YqjE
VAARFDAILEPGVRKTHNARFGEETVMAKIRHPKDFAAGLMFIAFGVGALVIGNAYPMGTAARMGPGYFPRILGLLLLLLGAFVTLRSFRLQGSSIEIGSLKAMGVVLGSIVLFGLTAPSLGLVIATVLLIVVSSAASSEFRWKEALLSSAILAVASVAGFIYGLGLQFSVWPTFLN